MRKCLRCFVALMYLAAINLSVHAADRDSSPHNSETPVTPVAGESWINHLHRSFGDTSMGKTGQLGPGAPEPGDEKVGWQVGLLSGAAGQTVTLHGADLYRLNCRACHGEAGLGAPPEINSVINPVRATSVAMVVERMKKTGMDISPAAAAELAKQSKDALLQRLHNGGESMPPFPHLSDAEIRALLAYLGQLAGVPGAGPQLAVTASPAKVGEHIVKSTCHTCHDAAGANPTPQQLEDGAIPPLETLTTRTNQVEFIRKVTSGAPIFMGSPPALHRGRMPVFYYLSKDEAADVYLYLTQYPPSQVASSDVVVAASQENQTSNTPPPAPPAPITARASTIQRTRPAKPVGNLSFVAIAVLMGVGVFAVLLILCGFGVLTYAFLKLSAKNKRHSQPAQGSHAMGTPVR